eukprot:3834927-Amphidinium_carterae.1
MRQINQCSSCAQVNLSTSSQLVPLANIKSTHRAHVDLSTSSSIKRLAGQVRLQFPAALSTPMATL